MRITGIILIVFGTLAILGAFIQAMEGHDASLGGLSFVVLGTYLMSRAAKKKKEQAERDKWIKS